MKTLLLTLFTCLTLASCTENSRAKKWGGTSTVQLQPNTKLVNVTWKEADLWYLTRPIRTGETPETLTFTEQSSWGLIQGKVEFKETIK